MTSQPIFVAPGIPAPQRRNRWYNNWKILVPVVLGALLLTLALVVLGLVWFVHSLFADSYPYKVAIESASKSSAAAAEIGVPFHAGWVAGERLDYQNYDADAHLIIPISGPKGRGQIVVIGKAHDGRWTFQTLEVFVEGQSIPIELSNPAPAPVSPPAAPETQPSPEVSPGSV